MSIKCTIRSQGPRYYSPQIEPLLRLHRGVRYDSPIVTAYLDGDVSAVQKIFTSAEVSPSVLVEMSTRAISLIELDLGRIIAISDMRSHVLHKLSQLFQDLVRHGLDPGQALCADVTESCTSMLPRIATVAYAVEFGALLADVARTKVHKSSEDPFYMADFNDMLWFKDKASLIAPAGEILLN